MPHDSPLRKLHDRYAESRRAAPPAGAHRPGAARGVQTAQPAVEYVPCGAACELVATFGDIESEYAAIRRGAGLLDWAHRGTLRIAGDHRREFLNRLLTQELKDLAPGRARRSFLLNRAGRIEADLLLVETGDHVLADVDLQCAQGAAGTLGQFLFTERVEITDVTDEFHRLGAHGPEAMRAMGAAAGIALELEPGHARQVRVAGIETVVAREDPTGEIGLAIFVPLEGAAAVWEALLAAGGGRQRVRPAGWFAFNTARIEAGTPLFNIDFGTSNLPHETGALHDRVSFRKGCYVGQEIVARTEHLGRPKQTLVGLRMTRDLLPVAEAPVLEGPPASPSASPIGAVTSSTLSPMLGRSPVAFAMLRSASAARGTSVLVSAEGELAEAMVGPLRFYPPPEATP